MLKEVAPSCLRLQSVQACPDINVELMLFLLTAGLRCCCLTSPPVAPLHAPHTFALLKVPIGTRTALSAIKDKVVKWQDRCTNTQSHISAN